ncbi:MAG: serine hydrolase, partial [Proteobacteria bacterium]|nr:serine hydrolase [Pseudomonadota bacterium]
MIETVTPESVGMSSARLARVDAWLERQVAQERLAGASVLIGRRGQPAYFNCAGRADIENGKAFDDDTIVRIFSMTKAVTTVAAMMLYEEGAFQLDDPIARYLPEFRDTRVWTGGDADATETMPMEIPITVHHLMTHTSGLTYGFMRTNPVDRMYRQQGMEFPGGADTLAGLVERLAQIPLICQPGTEWNYSVSIDVLGRLVEVWSGMSLQAFFTERLFQPLRMTDTGFHVREANHHRLAALYAPLSGGDMSTVAAGVVDQFAEKP